MLLIMKTTAFVVCEEKINQKKFLVVSALTAPDEAYANITEGAWINDLDYDVVYRVAIREQDRKLYI